MRLLLIGGGGHASDILGILEAQNVDFPIGIIADDPIDPSRFQGRCVDQLGAISDISKIDASHYIVAIGYSGARKAVADRVVNLGLEPMTLIHPRAWVATGVSIGAGTAVFAGAIVSPMAMIGEHACIHHNSVVGHDCQIGDFATILPSATVSGGVILGEACLIGSGATVLERCVVGQGARVGAGAVVTKNVPEGATVVGVPARLVNSSTV